MNDNRRLTSSTTWISDRLEELETAKRRRVLACRESPPIAGQVQIDGQSYINFASNDYLGIAADERLVEAVRHVAGQVGWGAAASPLVTGRGVWHRRLEREIAKFKQTEAALLFPTGFAANVGTITALAGRGDVIFSDALNHASIIDGCKLSAATVVVYEHRDIEHLDSCLSEQVAASKKLIVTDSLFSMDGDFAPLVELVGLAQKHSAMLLVDEAHATGIWGARGSGICEMLGVEEFVDARVGTLSKALGSLGGFVAGTQDLVELVANQARTYMFSTAQPEAISAASLAALEIVEQEPERRVRLQSICKSVRSGLEDQGWNCGGSTSQIIPIVIGDEPSALALSQRLRAQGILVPAIRPPAVPVDQCLLRIGLSSGHSDEQLEMLLASLSREADSVGRPSGQ